MSAIAISVRDLTKQYVLGGRKKRNDSLREHLTDGARRVFRRSSPALRHDTIWALDGVSLDIELGQVVGLVGRNGAGKTTLLKVLTRITEPTSGRAEIYGRVGSLLEVGTGFHPDLSGRENIYLNGAIMGLSRAEITRRFDEIVAFAEVDRFLDTPVKRYSSGMYVRLAFAVAAHTDSEILLVDEVLAVGDEAFREKCLGRIGSVVREGRTVLFVSHSLAAISALCPTTIWMKDGKVVQYGDTRNVMTQYLEAGGGSAAEAEWAFSDAPTSPVAKLRAVRVLNQSGRAANDIWLDEPITLQVEFWMLETARTDVVLQIVDQVGVVVLSTGNFNDEAWTQTPHQPGLYSCSWEVPAHLLNEGRYHVGISLRKGRGISADVREAVSFNVVDPGHTRGAWTEPWPGVVRPVMSWTGSRVGDLPREPAGIHVA